MAGPPRKKKEKTVSRISEAVSFVMPATQPGKLDYQQYIRISGGFAVAFDGTIAAGFPVEEELTVCPQADKLDAALKKCGTDLTIAVLPSGSLSVKGGKLRAVVPCLADTGILPPVFPDPPVAVITDELKEGFKALAKLANDKAETVLEASILLQSMSMVATNRIVMLEYWHGIDLPPGLVIPKAFASAVVKQTVPLTGFGFGPHSVTFHYENGAWLRTQLFQDQYPDYRRIMDVPSYPIPTPEGLLDAIEAVASFSDSDTVLIRNGRVTTNREDEIGAQHEVAGLEINGDYRAFAPSLFKKIASFCETIDLNTYDDRAFFFGGSVRGAIMGKRA
ncbi:hypothetical protein [Sphingomonas phage Kimi]|nr:hypothetical protein [Sphingomonas phage Kimi]